MTLHEAWTAYQLARQRLKAICRMEGDKEPYLLRASRERAKAKYLVRKAIDAAREAKRLA